MALVKPAQYVDRNPGVTMGTFRLYLGFRETNGLAACGAVIQNGRSILIDEDRMTEWIRTGQQQWDRVTERATRKEFPVGGQKGTNGGRPRKTKSEVQA